MGTNDQLLKGMPGEPALKGDLTVTDTDQTTTLFAVKKAAFASGGGEVTLSKNAKGSGILSANVTAAATAVGTTAQNLMTYSLPANQLRAGRGVKIRAWGSTAANANNKTVALAFGATTLISSGALAANNKDWELEARVFFGADTTHQVAAGRGQANGAAIQAACTAPTEDAATAVTIAMVGTDGTSSASDITCKGMTVELV